MGLFMFGTYPVLFLVVVVRLKSSGTWMLKWRAEMRNGTQFIRTSALIVELELENNKVTSCLVPLLPT
jgi:hypothetical protein